MITEARTSEHQTEGEIYLTPGTRLQAAGVTFRISEGSTPSTVFLVNIHTHDARSCTPEELLEAIRRKTVRALPTAQLAQAPLVPIHLRDDDQRLLASIPPFLRSDAAIRDMLTKRKWIKLLRVHGVKSFMPDAYLAASVAEVEHKTGEKCPIGIHTIYDAARALRRNEDDPRALLPHYHLRGGPGGHRLDPRLEQIIANALEAAANPSAGRLQASRIHDAVVSQVKQVNRTFPQDPLPFASVPTVTRRFKDRFTAYEICVRNYGSDRADSEFRQAGVRVRAERPLDVVQYDDLNTGVFMIDERTKLPWGRCWLTSGVDECTAAPMGMSMSERPRSTESALEAVILGIFPKDHSQPDYADCAGKWEWYGHHGLITLDNASYNDTMRLQASVLEFGGEVQFARPYHPEDKSDIEHFNHRLRSEFIVNEPGWAGPKEDRDMLEYGLGTAILTTNAFARRLRRWTVDDYANKSCGKAGKTPRQAWGEFFSLLPPFLPKRVPSQELMGTVIDELTFRDSGGLLRLRLRYQSKELELLEKRLGQHASVVIRYSLRTLEYLFVLDPYTKHYLRVPCIEDARYVIGVTDYQQRLILKRARHMKLHSPGVEQMVKARDALVADTLKLATSKKISERKLSVLLKQSGLTSYESQQSGGSAWKAPKASGADSLVLVSSLEQMILDMAMIELEAEPDMEISSLA